MFSAIVTGPAMLMGRFAEAVAPNESCTWNTGPAAKETPG
jgi:hypothetical protein